MKVVTVGLLGVGRQLFREHRVDGLDLIPQRKPAAWRDNSVPQQSRAESGPLLSADHPSPLTQAVRPDLDVPLIQSVTSILQLNNSFDVITLSILILLTKRVWLTSNRKADN